MENLDIVKATKKYCRELNKRIPCETQEEVNDCTRILNEYLEKHENSHLFWDTTLWVDCEKDATIARQKLMYSGECKFYPSDDPISHPGLFVRYKSTKKKK